jgi:outer membrane lipoprotein-sorting protein
MHSVLSNLAVAALSILVLVPWSSAQEDLSLADILERAYQKEKAFKENLTDYICQATTILQEPQKDGTAKTLSIVEKTVFRKLPDKRIEKYNTITKKGKELTPEEIAQTQKNQKTISLGRGRSFFGPEERSYYTYELMPPDTVRGYPTYVLRIKPKSQEMDLVDGKIWLHKDSFEVVRLHLQPAKTPRFVKKATVIFEFDEIQPGFWLPFEIIIEAQAGFLFIKKDRRIHETWRDYQINVGLTDSLFVEHR